MNTVITITDKSGVRMILSKKGMEVLETNHLGEPIVIKNLDDNEVITIKE